MPDYCIFCNKPAKPHHLCFGRGIRELADEDDLIIPVCDYHHTLAPKVSERIHDNIMAEKLSKMLGQALWEMKYYKEGGKENAREKYRIRYGKSYL